MDGLTPAAIVAALDKYIVGQREAKRAVAVALRARIRRAQLPDDLRDEVSPKNILMIGPTGVGKTEIARRVAKLVDAPFIKVEATRFTEVGFVGRDVESIVRDLLETSVDQVDTRRFEEVRPEAERAADERLATYLLQQREGPAPARRATARRGSGRRGGPNPTLAESPGPSAEERRGQRQRLLAQLQARQLEGEMVEIEVEIAPPDSYDLDGLDGPEGAAPAGRGRRAPTGPEYHTRRLPVAEARRILTDQEADQLIDWDGVLDAAIRRVEEGGIVFLDEVDKIVGDGEGGPNVSDEGGAARSPADRGGDDGHDALRPRQDRSRPLHRGGRVQRRQTERPDPGVPGALPDPRWSCSRSARKTSLRSSPSRRTRSSRQYTALLATEGVTLTFEDEALREIAALAGGD